MPRIELTASAFRVGHRWSVSRILRQIGEPIGRADTIGRPWLRRLKTRRRISLPRRQAEIIGEIGAARRLPILQPMAGALNALFSALRDHSPPWVWTIDLAFYEGHDPAHGFEATREAAMKAFGRS